LQPFYQIHHGRYVCYWYQQTPENFAKSDMAQLAAAAEALKERTVDFVAPGEQQSEAGHEYNYSSNSGKGNYNGESYRDAGSGGYVEFALFNPDGLIENLSVLLRFTTADKGRKATLTVDGEKLGDIVIPESVKGADDRGFFNMEYPLSVKQATDAATGRGKAKFVVRLTADKGTMTPGLYYLRLMKDYNTTYNDYQFRAKDWTTGDVNRVDASKFTYDTKNNIIKLKQTGNNNICLMLDFSKLDYSIDDSRKWLIVRGSGLSTASGKSYLWWLNGINHGSQVSPNTVKTLNIGGQPQQLIAWDMSKSGLYDNFSLNRNSVCVGQTIFGLTSANSDGSVEIYDINFIADINQYINTTTPVSSLNHKNAEKAQRYTLDGRKATGHSKGLYITQGKVMTM